MRQIGFRQQRGAGGKRGCMAQDEDTAGCSSESWGRALAFPTALGPWLPLDSH